MGENDPWKNFGTTILAQGYYYLVFFIWNIFIWGTILFGPQPEPYGIYPIHYVLSWGNDILPVFLLVIFIFSLITTRKILQPNSPFKSKVTILFIFIICCQVLFVIFSFSSNYFVSILELQTIYEHQLFSNIPHIFYLIIHVLLFGFWFLWRKEMSNQFVDLMEKFQKSVKITMIGLIFAIIWSLITIVIVLIPFYVTHIHLEFFYNLTEKFYAAAPYLALVLQFVYLIILAVGQIILGKNTMTKLDSP